MQGPLSCPAIRFGDRIPLKVVHSVTAVSKVGIAGAPFWYLLATWITAFQSFRRPDIVTVALVKPTLSFAEGLFEGTLLPPSYLADEQ
jgi:hypothetical protein